jgi:hypothetical protein
MSSRNNWRETAVPAHELAAEADWFKDFQPHAVCLIKSGDNKIALFTGGSNPGLLFPTIELPADTHNAQGLPAHITDRIDRKFARANAVPEVSFLNIQMKRNDSRVRARGFKRGKLLLPHLVSYDAPSTEITAPNVPEPNERNTIGWHSIDDVSAVLGTNIREHQERFPSTITALGVTGRYLAADLAVVAVSDSQA